MDARKSLSAIHRQAQGNLDEKGINTLFTVAGLATWTLETGVRPNAPVILIPIAATPVDAARWDFKIELSGDPHLNPVLAHVLRTEYGIDPSDLDGDLVGGLPKSFSGLTALLSRQAIRWSKVRGLSIESRLVLGNFIYTNMPMVADLENNLESFAVNDLIAAIAGVEEARLALAAGIQDPSPSQPDLDPPESEFLVLDADASQHKAINGSWPEGLWLSGARPGPGSPRPSRISYPPSLPWVSVCCLWPRNGRPSTSWSTGSTGQGWVISYWTPTGASSPNERLPKVWPTRCATSSPFPTWTTPAMHLRLAERRTQLIDHNDALHQRRPPWNVTLYEVQEKIIGASEQVRSCGGMRSDQARGLDRETMDQLMRVVQEWVDLGGHQLESRNPEWAGSKVSSPEEAQEALRLVRDLATVTLPDTRSLVFAALDEVRLAYPGTVGDWLELLQWLAGVEQFGNRFSPDVYNLDYASLVMHLSPGGPLVETCGIRVFRQLPEIQENGGVSPPDSVKNIGSGCSEKVAKLREANRMKPWFGAALLICILLSILLIGCQNSISDEDMERIADRIAESPVHEETVNQWVDALLAHPTYLKYLDDFIADDEMIEAFVTAMVEHPAYQTTPEEDCATFILMAVAASGDYTLPLDSEVDELCAWYVSQSE